MFTISIITTAIVYLLTAITIYRFKAFYSLKTFVVQFISGLAFTCLLLYFEWYICLVILNLLSIVSLIWSYSSLNKIN